MCINEASNLSKEHILIMRKFKDIISETFANNKEKIIEFINSNRVKYADLINSNVRTMKTINIQNINIGVYNLKYDLEYDKLYKLIMEINNGN